MMDKFELDRNNAMFLVIDVQKNLAAAMKKDVAAMVEGNINIIISASKILNVPVLCTEQYSKGLGPTLDSIVKSLGADFKPVEKLVFSACAEKEFQDSCKAIQRKYVMVCGIESHVCVLQTSLDLLEQGHIVHVISDATCSRYKNDWKNAMNYLRNAGAVISTTEIAVFQLLQKAGTPEFKAISPMFKNKEAYWSI
jgi:nicotinamidase-related amidase